MFRGKSLIVTVFCGFVFTGASATAAFAGEVTGTGEDTAGPAHANSICVFSGKNDDPQGLDPVENGPGGVSQSYGQDIKLGSADPHVFNPGDACRGGSNFARQ